MPVEHSKSGEKAEAFSHPVGTGGYSDWAGGGKVCRFFLPLLLTNGSVWL